MGYSPMAGAYCVMKKLNYILKPAQKAATVKHVQQQTVRHIIFHINCGRFCLQFFSRFSRGQNYVREISKFKAHILKFLRPFFSFLPAEYNKLNFSYHFRA